MCTVFVLEVDIGLRQGRERGLGGCGRREGAGWMVEETAGSLEGSTEGHGSVDDDEAVMVCKRRKEKK